MHNLLLLRRRSRFSLAAWGIAFPILLADMAAPCGGRGPRNDEPVETATSDASTSDSSAGNATSPDTSTDAP